MEELSELNKIKDLNEEKWFKYMIFRKFIQMRGSLFDISNLDK